MATSDGKLKFSYLKSFFNYTGSQILPSFLFTFLAVVLEQPIVSILKTEFSEELAFSPIQFYITSFPRASSVEMIIVFESLPITWISVKTSLLFIKYLLRIYLFCSYLGSSNRIRVFVFDIDPSEEFIISHQHYVTYISSS